MRDLNYNELEQVYGAGSKGRGGKACGGNSGTGSHKKSKSKNKSKSHKKSKKC